MLNLILCVYFYFNLFVLFENYVYILSWILKNYKKYIGLERSVMVKIIEILLILEICECYDIIRY